MANSKIEPTVYEGGLLITRSYSPQKHYFTNTIYTNTVGFFYFFATSWSNEQPKGLFKYRDF